MRYSLFALILLGMVALGAFIINDDAIFYLVLTVILIALLALLWHFLSERRKKQKSAPETDKIQYFIRIDNETYGPFSLSELKINYGECLTEDTLITTDTLNGEWYEAKCFECFD